MQAEFRPVIAKATSVRQLYAPQAASSAAGKAAVDLKSTPTVSPEIDQVLPQLLQIGCEAFDDRRKKDIFLLTALTVLSGCMPPVYGLYDGKRVHANLFLFIIAPPASGKSAMLWGQRLGSALESYKEKKSKQARKEYEIRRLEALARKEPFFEEEPAPQLLFIPGNASASAFMRALKDNGEVGIMVESEADVLTGAFKQDWGNFSHLLRQAFHHEPASSLRNGARAVFDRPALSIALSGTEGQATTLLQSTENGLLSRFMYYIFSAETEWRSVAPDAARPVLDDLFKDLANSTLDMAQLVGAHTEIRFDFTPAQWQMFNGVCEEWLTIAVGETSADMSSVIFRHGLIIYRIAMVLGVIRAYENSSLSDQLICQEIDFSIAVNLGELLIRHATVTYERLPGKPMPTNTHLMQFYKALPGQFVRESANQIGLVAGIKIRTITTYLKHLVKQEFLEKTEHGKYRKARL